MLQVEALRTSLPGSTPVPLSAALSFVLAGVALTLREHRYLRLSLAIAVMGLGVLSLTQHVLGISFGVERLVVPRDLEAMQVESGRMALSSTCAFILLGIALLQLTTRRIERRRINETIAVVVGGVALLAIGVDAAVRAPRARADGAHSALHRHGARRGRALRRRVLDQG